MGSSMGTLGCPRQMDSKDIHMEWSMGTLGRPRPRGIHMGSLTDMDSPMGIRMDTLTDMGRSSILGTLARARSQRSQPRERRTKA